jgi:hypothetical protein
VALGSNANGQADGVHRHRVLKGWEEQVGSDLFETIQALAESYQAAIVGMAEAVAAARTALAADPRLQSLGLQAFEQVFRDEVLNAIRRTLPDVSDELAAEVFRSAEASYGALPSGLSARFRFDAKDPRAVAWAENRAGTMIVQISTETLSAVRQIISRTLAEGGGIPRAAREIERVVGLHDRWQRAVDNFYLREIDRISATKPIDVAVEEAQANAIAYHDTLVRARALNIARTEILAAQNIGQILSWYQAADNGVLNLGLAEKEWVVGPDGWRGINVCDECMDLAGKRVPVTDVFPNGEFSPPLHPNCRCTMNLIPQVDVEIPEDGEEVKIPVDEGGGDAVEG